MSNWDERIYPDDVDKKDDDVDLGGSYKVLSEPVKLFVTYFYKAINDNCVYDIQNAYETGFPRLTDKFFNKQKWPTYDVIAPLVGQSEIFEILYKELYYRHIYAHVTNGPTIEERFDSYYNYCALFNLILISKNALNLELPNQWMWDIIDEFIYQFQSFSQFKSKLKSKSDIEVNELREHANVWNVHSVLNVLHSLVDKGNITDQMRVFSQRGNLEEVAGEFGNHPLYKMLAFFSLLGLCRLHCLLSDYYQALRVLNNVDMSRMEIYCGVPTCQITTSYYVAFSYMMMRRYQDAIRVLSNVLVYIQKLRGSLSARPDVLDYVQKQAKQMYTLLCICLTLHPMRVDEVVHQNLKEEYAEKTLRLQRLEMAEFEQSFQFSCPKFLSPTSPNFDELANSQMNPLRRQLELFMEEIQQQAELPNIRSYLKLYSTLPLKKLAAFMEIDEERLQTELMCYKHKLQNMACAQGAGLEGEFQSGSEVDFYIDGDMIYVADTKVARKFGEYFIRQIVKLEDVNKGLEALDAHIYAGKY